MGRGAATSLMRINDVERSAPGDVDDPAGARYLRWRTTDSAYPACTRTSQVGRREVELGFGGCERYLLWIESMCIADEEPRVLDY